MKRSRRWLGGIVVSGLAAYSFIILGLSSVGYSPPLVVSLPVVLPGFALAALGVNAPLTQGGGGLAWLTPLGVILVYALPGGILLYSGRKRKP